MSNTPNPPEVAGTDGNVPINLQSNLFQIWALDQVYLGQTAAGKYVVKIGDRVIDRSTDEEYKVTAVDQVTLIPTLVLTTAIPDSQFGPDDILLGVGPGTQSDTYRIYIDKSVTPYALSVDRRLRVAGSTTTNVIIFKGNILDGTAVAVSAVFDSTGSRVGVAVPLELVASLGMNNISIKMVPTCYTQEDLTDGEIVTAVFYSDDSVTVSKRQLIVENTAFISNPDTAVKYVTGISIQSPFLSPSDPGLILFPINTLLSGLSLEGVINYSDGSTLVLPVDGNRMSLSGFNPYVATIVGQMVPLVLTYNLAPNEVAYGANSVGNRKFISLNLRAQTLNTNGIYTPKLFAYPVWIDQINGYRLKWWLYNLDRNVVLDATPYVTVQNNSPSFNPIGYGIKQTLTVAVNLSDVSSTFGNYNHIQTVAISLVTPGSSPPTNWTIQFDPNQFPAFGNGNVAKTTLIQQNLFQLDITCGETVLANWIQRMYLNTEPLTDPQQEVAAPVPNFFSIVTSNGDVAFPISEWNQVLPINNIINNLDTLFVKFFLRTADNDVQLSIAGLPVHQTN